MERSVYSDMQVKVNVSGERVKPIRTRVAHFVCTYGHRFEKSWIERDDDGSRWS